MTKLSKNCLVNEWNLFFDALARVFSNCGKKGFINIPSLIQKIAYALVFNRRINFAQLIWRTMVVRLTSGKRDFSEGDPVTCYYPRFLTLIINNILEPHHINLYNNSHYENSPSTTKRFYSRLNKNTKILDVPVVISRYMSNKIGRAHV